MIPIIQSTTFKYDTSAHMGAPFVWRRAAIYTRLANPTSDAVAAKIAALEGGHRRPADPPPGQAANFFATFNLCSAGDHICSSSTIYGGTLTCSPSP